MKTNLKQKEISSDEVERYSRQMMLPEVGLEGQLALRKARVLVIGAGGIGSSCLMYLAAAGLGTIGIVDDDVVDVSNLHRQVIHGEAQAGMPKVFSASERMKAINSFVKVETHQCRINKFNVENLVAQYDVVLDGSDNALTRYIINDACVIQKKTLISGAAVKWEGQLTIYNLEDGPCYRCMFPECPKGDQMLSCSGNGVMGMAPGVIGQLVALECVKYFTGAGQLLHKRMLIFDALNANYRVVKLRGRVADCVVCGKSPSLISCKDYNYDEFVGAGCQISHHSELLHATWEELLSGEKDKKIIVDCRPHVQHSIVHFVDQPNLIHIPLDVLTKSSADEIKDLCDLKHSDEKGRLFQLTP